MNSTVKIVGGIALLLLAVFSVWYFVGTSKSKEPVTSKPSPTITMAPATSESPQFQNTIWTATSIAGNPTVSDTLLTVQFDDQGRINGSDGCNTFSTQYSTSGTSLTINQAMVSTKKACEENVMTQADTFTQIFLATTSYTLGDGMLVLNQGNSSGLTFTGQSNPLSKTSWNVTGYNNGKQAVVSPMTETTLTITFGDDGTISGTAGCNTFSGQYSLNGQSISISPLATTTMACIEPEGIEEQETAFLNALQKSVEWQMQGNQLSLRSAEDQLAVTAINTLTTSNP